jgi:phage host-nuclease inhibitor protein Gam
VQIAQLQAQARQAAVEAQRTLAAMEGDYKSKLGLAMAEIKALSRAQMEVGDKLEEVTESYSTKLQAVVEQVGGAVGGRVRSLPLRSGVCGLACPSWPGMSWHVLACPGLA